MDQSAIYALDFDGVICDSAIETGIAGWKAASRLWDDMQTPFPRADLVEQFREVRPIIETGYESIMAMRLLFDGDGIDAILQNFDVKKQQLVRRHGLDCDELKRLFGQIRDQWINESPDEWRQMNPLFPGVAEKLAHLSEQGLWYIVTTKQERFVSEILDANKITIPESRIFGLDRNMSKEEVLTGLLAKHPEHVIYFVEDRLPTLLKILKNDKLQTVKLFFADWGYNTKEDKLDAAQLPIQMISLEDFLL